MNSVARKLLVSAVVLLVCAPAGGAWAATGSETGKTTSDPAKDTGSQSVSIDVKDTKVVEILDSFAKQTKVKILVETSVTGSVSTTLTEIPLEAALTAVSKVSGKMEWRKLYLAADSDLMKQPDRLASTVRLMAGFSFPSLVVAGSSTGKLAAHFDDKKGVTAAEDAAAKTLGMVKVYLVTNDAAIAAKAKADEKKETKDALDKYTKLQQDQIDAFLKMTPEQREKAILAQMDLMERVGPEYMGAAMEALARADPEAMRQRIARQTEMMLNMSPESRRAMIRLSMKSQQAISPELKRLLEEDAKAVMEEMKSEQGGDQ